MEGGRGHDRLVSWAPRRQLEQQRVQLVVLQQEHERPVEREQQHRFSSRKPLQADAGPIWRGPGVFLPAAPSAAPRVRDYSDRPCGLTFVPASLNGAGKKSAGRSVMPPPRPDGLWLFAAMVDCGLRWRFFGRLSSHPTPAPPSAPSLHLLPTSNTPPPEQPTGTFPRPTGVAPRSCRPR